MFINAEKIKKNNDGVIKHFIIKSRGQLFEERQGAAEKVNWSHGFGGIVINVQNAVQ